MAHPYDQEVATQSTPIVGPDGRLPEGENKTAAVRAMFDDIAPRYDLVNRVMTFGLDVIWRRRAVRDLALPRHSTVLDLACGTGDFCRELDRADIDPIGADLALGMLRHARTDAPLVQGDALSLPLPDASVDGVTCGFALRNVADLDDCFSELARVVRPGGRIALLEVSQPANPVLRWGHEIYFGKIVPLIGGLLSNKAAYQYLPRSVEYLPEPDVMRAMLATRGFVSVRRVALTLGITQLLTATRDTDT